MVDGVLYVTTPYNNAAALDAETGKELWRFDSGAVKLGGIPGTGFKHRAPGAVARRQGRQQAARAAEHPQPAVQPRRADRQAGRLVRRPRRGLVDRRLSAADFRRPACQPRRIAAGRLPRHRRRRQLDSRSLSDDQRAAGHRPGVRCADRQAAVVVERHPAVADRLRRRDVGGRVVAVQRPRQRLGSDGGRRRLAA